MQTPHVQVETITAYIRDVKSSFVEIYVPGGQIIIFINLTTNRITNWQLSPRFLNKIVPMQVNAQIQFVLIRVSIMLHNVLTGVIHSSGISPRQ